MEKIDPGAGAWLVVCSALVLLMAPALALFYGGRVPVANAKSMVIRWAVGVPILGIQWILFGYSLAFGPTRHGLIGGLAYVGMTGGVTDVSGAVPAIAFGACRMMFAVIAPALISGALGARMKIGAYVAFVLFWSTLVYDPVAHWLWAHGGWLSRIGALDFAGGIAVHCTTGVSAVVCALVIAKDAADPGHPARRTLATDVVTAFAGAAVLWFGWSALSAGAALASGNVLGLSFVTTQLGAAGGGVGWLIVEWFQRGRPTATGVASGVVSGLVATTPAAGFVAPSAAVAIGFIAGAIGYGTGLGVVSGLIAGLLAITAAAGHVEPAMAIALALLAGAICHAAVLLKVRFGSSRSPDPFCVQGIGGLAGALLTGVFAQKAINRTGADGALFGNVTQVAVQAIACAAIGLYAALVTFLILKLIEATIGLRVPDVSVAEPGEDLAAEPPAARAA